MIPQNLTSPPSLKKKSLGNDKVFSKCPNQGLESEESKEGENYFKNESEESIVQWKHKNIKDGFVVVDEAQLSKLIKREPIGKYYKLEQEPFAKGLFTSVRRCQSLETGESYAAKFTSRDRYGEDCSAEIYHEIALLSLCGSAPRVIQIHDVFETFNEIIIVMEYAPGGDLQTIIDEDLVPFESEVMSFIRQTVEGLEYLHRRKIAHLDIKPQNIVMMGEYPHCEVKLCDFEISRVILEGNEIRELLGTPDYVAPEILHYDPITLAADMWSLGVTTYVLLTGFSPFGGETDQETFCNISRGDVDFPDDLFKDVSNEAIDFVKSLLVKNPKSRLTASDCLKHPWLSRKQQSVGTTETKAPTATVNEFIEKSDAVNGARNSCETCETQKDDSLCDGQLQSDQSVLRKYLSKSREALFDKVVQKHNNHNNNNNIKKSTFKNSRFRRTRLCESQISLFSKSQEKLLGGETLNAPSRSIEKLYGLRSLSKSQEVLNLYKNGGLLASQDNLNLVSELIKSRENLFGGSDVEATRERKLMRATTADLGVLHQRNKPTRMYSYSSTTSLASFSNNMPEEEDEERDGDDENQSVSETVLKPITTRDSEVMQNLPNGETNDEIVSLNKELEELERKRSQKISNGKDDDEEPRFTVAQLVTAYNKHQEIVTRTSLEVTMLAQEKKVKIPPIIPYNSKSSFPTGPTALRLFIPDIDLVAMPKKFVPKYKMRFPDVKTTEKEKSLSPTESDDLSGRLLSSGSDSSSINLTSIINSKNRKNQEESIYSKNIKSTKKPEREKPPILILPQRRSKSSSPVIEPYTPERGSVEIQRTDDVTKKRSPTPNRKLTVNRSVERSPSATRKSLPTERSLRPQRKTCTRSTKAEESSHRKGEPSWPHYKIVGYGEKNLAPNRASSGVSYKIEFDSPVVKRKFPVRNVPTKGTISSNLKIREVVNKCKK